MSERNPADLLGLGDVKQVQDESNDALIEILLERQGAVYLMAMSTESDESEKIIAETMAVKMALHIAAGKEFDLGLKTRQAPVGWFDFSARYKDVKRFFARQWPFFQSGEEPCPVFVWAPGKVETTSEVFEIRSIAMIEQAIKEHMLELVVINECEADRHTPLLPFEDLERIASKYQIAILVIADLGLEKEVDFWVHPKSANTGNKTRSWRLLFTLGLYLEGDLSESEICFCWEMDEAKNGRDRIYAVPVESLGRDW